jgi:hypothetical protein
MIADAMSQSGHLAEMGRSVLRPYTETSRTRRAKEKREGLGALPAFWWWWFVFSTWWKS